MELLHLLNYDLSWHDRERWDRAIHLMERFFAEQREELAPVAEKARIVKFGIDEVDAFIQRNTAVVCPHCTNVCCINKHGYYDFEDLIYIFSLGINPPVYEEGVLDTDSCQFISERGCTIERAVRPFRCNWHFCNALITHIEEGPAKPYRAFEKRLQEVMDLRSEMLHEFFTILRMKTERC